MDVYRQRLNPLASLLSIKLHSWIRIFNTKDKPSSSLSSGLSSGLPRAKLSERDVSLLSLDKSTCTCFVIKREKVIISCVYYISFHSSNALFCGNSISHQLCVSVLLIGSHVHRIYMLYKLFMVNYVYFAKFKLCSIYIWL